MEKILKERLNYLVDKLEGFLFGDNTGLTQNQVQYFQSLFSTDSYLFSADLLKFFKQEIFVGFAFNLLFVWIIFFFLPLNFYMCWECNNVMTSWLIGLGLFNVIMIVPKVFLIRKLLRIEEATDIYIANYSLWMFFKSKVYQINMTMSRYIFCSYIIGIFMLVITNGEVLHCEKFYGLMTLLFGSFALRAAFGFLKFVQNFSASPQGIESPSNIFAGISNKEMCSLAIIKVKEYKKKYNRDDEDCPICYVKYNNDDELRVMECSGNHGFHKKCIDEWLVKSNKCPQCRMSVFEQREKNENNEMKEE